MEKNTKILKTVLKGQVLKYPHMSFFDVSFFANTTLLMGLSQDNAG